jgi:hypothetical protein
MLKSLLLFSVRPREEAVFSKAKKKSGTPSKALRHGIR